MLIGISALENTDWSKLHHAYGRATDTPGHLRAFLAEDIKARRKAMQHLYGAIIHQGTPWTATGPVALVIAGFLTDKRIDRGESVRGDLIAFLVSVSEICEQADSGIDELEEMASFDLQPFLESDDDDAIYENEDAANALYARTLLDCLRVVPVIWQAMTDSLGHNDPRVRTQAAMGSVALVKTEPLRSHTKDLETQLLALTDSAANSDELSSLILALGNLGYMPIAYLNNPSPGVRLCAALAPSLAENDTAINELINALEQHAAGIDGWFIERPPQFERQPRFYVVERLINQIKNFDRLENTAIAVVKVTTKMCVDFDWGPLFAMAFADGNGTIKTESQRRFLESLVAREEFWDTKFGNAWKWFIKAGLPIDRDHCIKLIADSAVM